jgi:endo-1,4-beta-mannosidase
MRVEEWTVSSVAFRLYCIHQMAFLDGHRSMYMIIDSLDPHNVLEVGDCSATDP